ncbi:Outer membrane protein (porin) [Paraburkholderia steynii]|uniref:Outer membrane protein (Porin) n=1 Tax=Paraburkholderia steynii TaxID=1245441 RepID=A0A7Z7BAY2_9BURK|nr:porin [Paraburkholderia steynii]SDI49907.1 Outer membrane protein (porin) [Paraburkholderia steynii]
MQKSITMISVGLLIACRASAQSSVTAYGLLDSGISYISNEGGHASLKFADGMYAPNLMGFQGMEELGGGTKAIFKLEDQFQLGTGSILMPGLFGRNAYIGLDDARFGTLTLGNVYEFMFSSLTGAGNSPGLTTGGLHNFPAGPFQKLALPANATGWFDWSNTSGTPVHNAVRYQSPTFAGLSIGALYSFGGVAGSFGSNSAVSLGMNYDAGPLGIGAAYTNRKYPGATGGSPQISIRNWGVGAHYAFGQILATANFVTVRNEFNGAHAYAGQLGGTWQISPIWSLGANYIYMKGNSELDNNHASQVGALLNYELSKRTTLYAEGVYQRANSGANASINGITDPNGSSTTPTQAIARVGMHTVF